MKLSLSFGLLIFVVGCSQISIYEQVASSLVTVDVKKGVGYSGAWYPLGTNPQAILSESQHNLFSELMINCINQLEQNNVKFVGKRDLPGEMMATAQLILCMQREGWGIKIEKIVTT